MQTLEIPTNGIEVKLSGDQVRFIRTVLNESQAKFARRLAVSQPVVYRIESKGPEICTGPEIILIDMLARQYQITVPAEPFVKPKQTADA